MKKILCAALIAALTASVLVPAYSLADDDAPKSPSDKKAASKEAASKEAASEAKANKPAAKKSADKQDSSADDLAAIRAGSQKFVAAFNKGDAKAVAALWTEDGEYVDSSGRTFEGRDAIAQEYADFFAAHKGHKLQLAIDSLKLLSEDAAIEDGRVMLDPTPSGPPAMSQYTAVHIKKNGEWLMSSVRDARIETPSAYRQLTDLEWMIGSWSSDERG